MTTATTTEKTAIKGLHPSPAEPLSFAPGTDVRAFMLEREDGNLLIYSNGAVAKDWDWLARAGVERQYLNHWHELLFGLPPAELGARLFHHRAESAEVERRRGEHGTSFDRRHALGGDFEAIPIPGHTPGATAYLWDNGQHRLLFTGDSLMLTGEEWTTALLATSDRASYLESLELIRELDFDVLVPWAASHDGPWFSMVSEAERRRRVDRAIARMRAGS